MQCNYNVIEFFQLIRGRSDASVYVFFDVIGLVIAC